MSDNFQKPFKKSIGAKPLREFPAIGGPDEEEVPSFKTYGSIDQFEISAEEEEALRKARKEKLNPSITPQAKTRLEYLADIGRLTKDVVIDGITFTLKTLKSKEQKQVYLTLVDVTNKVDEAYNIKYYSLAYSLIKIDQQNIEMMFKIDSLQDKIKLLEDLEESTTDRLFAAFEELKNTANDRFAIKTEEDIKEISDSLKK